MTPNQYLEPLFFFQLIVTSVFTARNSFPPLSSSSWLSYCPSVSSPPPLPPCLSTIVAISRLLCMDFDCSQGAILHVAQSSHTNTHAQTCMCRRGGERGGEKNLPLEDLFIKCAVKSCQAFHIRAHFPASGYLKERIQTRGRHNAISTTFTTVYFSYSKYSEPWMCTYGDHFIWIVNSCYWCWCQGFARRQIIKHRPRNLLMLQKNASL